MIQGQINALRQAVVPLELRGFAGQERDIEALVTEGGVLVGMLLLQGYHLFMDVVDGGEVRIQPRP